MDAHARLQERTTAIHLLRSGVAPTAVAAQLGRSPAWVYKWKARFADQNDFAALQDRSHAPRSCPRRLSAATCQAIVRARSELEAEAAAGTGLSYVGAAAVQARLCAAAPERLPSTASIERVLRRAGLVRPRTAPAAAAHYPHLHPREAHTLCQVDIVPHPIRGGPSVACFNAIDVVSGYATGYSYAQKRAPDAGAFLLHLWREQGIARYTQTDNESCFSGGYTHPNVLGHVVRLGLYVGTELVFSPVAHPQSNAYVERFHQDYNQHVWKQETFTTIAAVNARATGFFAQHRRSAHQGKLQGRTPAQVHQHPRRLPAEFRLPAGRLPVTEGRVHFMREIRADQTVSILNVAWAVPAGIPGTGLWATLELRCPDRARLQLFDAPPDAPTRRCLGEHAFPLQEPVQAIGSVFQRTGEVSLGGWVARLYRAIVQPAASWLVSTMS